MKSLIIFCSNYRNNTEKIAQIFADKIGSQLVNIRDAGEISDVDLGKYNLIGLGSGVYMESLSPELYKLADKLHLTGKNVFIFSTSGAGMRFYNNKLMKLLMSKGAINKGNFACKGSFDAQQFTSNKVFNIMSRLSQTHPNNKDFKAAEKFITRVVDSL